MPISDSFSSFIGNFRFPDFSLIANKQVWMSAVTIGLVASIETLLCLEAVDKLDPYKRISPPNRELFAQGVGNMASGLIGGLPMTSVIVRSSANVSSGAKTNVSTIAHGVILLFSALFISGYLNLIPLSALAAILLFVGYKLTKPSLFWEEYRKGFAHLIPFVVTLVAIVMTDLLKGIGVGLFVAGFFIIYENYKTAILVIKDESGNYILKFTKELSFLHKMELRGALSKLPNGINLMIDLTRTNFVDLDNAEIINDFILNSKHRNIQVEFKYKEGQTILKHINLPDRS
jgi:MFS superfamily sulfate permease-like transporter